MANTDSDPNLEASRDSYRPFVLASGGILVASILYAVIVWLMIDSPEARNAFGGMFGGLAALFSGLAFAGVIYALHLQRQELQLQRAEMVKTREQLEAQAQAQIASEEALRRQVAALERQNTTSVLALREQLRPYVVVSLPIVGRHLEIEIRNIGARPAFDVAVLIDPPLEQLQKGFTTSGPDYRPLLNQTYLPPDFRVRNMLSHTYSVATDESAPTRFSVSCTYSDGHRQYHEDYVIDIGAYLFKSRIPNLDTETSLWSIVKALATEQFGEDGTPYLEKLVELAEREQRNAADRRAFEAIAQGIARRRKIPPSFSRPWSPSSPLNSAIQRRRRSPAHPPPQPPPTEDGE
jgi:hypothetical protein